MSKVHCDKNTLPDVKTILYYHLEASDYYWCPQSNAKTQECLPDAMKAMLRAMHGHGHSCIWLTVLVFQYCFQQSASLIYWTAYVDVRYFDRESNETISSVCECGAFGQNSPLEPASGLIVLPNTDPLACSRNTTFTSSHQPWIALIKNGNCTYSWKIKAAQRHGASAVVIYNIDGAGNYTSLMPYTGMTVSLLVLNLFQLPRCQSMVKRLVCDY